MAGCGWLWVLCMAMVIVDRADCARFSGTKVAAQSVYKSDSRASHPLGT
jgi:hypothetical protein